MTFVLIYIIPALIAAGVARWFWRKPAVGFDGMARRLGAVFLFSLLFIYIWHGLWGAGLQRDGESLLFVAGYFTFFGAIAWIPAAYIVAQFRRGEE